VAKLADNQRNFSEWSYLGVQGDGSGGGGIRVTNDCQVESLFCPADKSDTQRPASSRKQGRPNFLCVRTDRGYRSGVHMWEMEVGDIVPVENQLQRGYTKSARAGGPVYEYPLCVGICCMETPYSTLPGTTPMAYVVLRHTASFVVLRHTASYVVLRHTSVKPAPPRLSQRPQPQAGSPPAISLPSFLTICPGTATPPTVAWSGSTP
jgi:hypothetical protein